MSGSRRYILDANVFIQAHQRYYPFDTCPGFWRAIIEPSKRKRICSIDRVESELTGAKDALSEWVKNEAPSGFFKQTADKAVIDGFASIVDWVNNEKQFTPAAKTEFAGIADGWLVAYAKSNGLVVVTQEEFRPDV